MFNFGMILTKNKATLVTLYSASTIGHIHTNSVLNTKIQTGIIKTDISDHFPIFFTSKCQIDLDDDKTENRNLQIVFSEISEERFKEKLREVSWDHVKTFENRNPAI